MAYFDPYGGSSINPANVSWRAITLATNLTLTWPQQTTDQSTLFARLNDVTATASGLSITLPDATKQSPGFDAFYRNIGGNGFTLLASDGSTIAAVGSGQVYYIYLVSNATSAGVWQTVLFGAAASNLDAASLQGNGLLAIVQKLNVAFPVNNVSANFTAATATRATVQVWTGGAGTITLPAASTLGTAFFFEVRNQGTGALTIAPTGELIDSSSSITLQPQDSGFIHAGSGVWYTVGRGRNQQFSFTLLTKTVTGGTTTLTQIEASNVVQKYSGTLTSNQIIVVPAVVQVYYVENLTSGAFSMTFQSPTPGTTVVVPQGQNAILFSDGVNLVNASTTISGIASIILNPGSAASPSLSFTSNTNTGIFQPTSNTIGFSANGVEVGRFTTTGLNSAIGQTTPMNANFSNVTLAVASGCFFGDFTTATNARNTFQTITTNGTTDFTAIPNGTSTTSAWSAFSNAAIINSPFLTSRIDGTIARVWSGALGSGTALPLALWTGTTEKYRIDVAGAHTMTATNATYAFPSTGGGLFVTNLSGSGAVFAPASGTGGVQFGTTTAVPLIFFANNSATNARVETNGLFNFTRAWDGTEGGIRMPVSANLKFGATVNANTTADWIFGTNGSDSLAVFRFLTGTGYVNMMALSNTGQLSASSFQVSSDIRFKTDIKNLSWDDGLEFLERVNPLTYEKDGYREAGYSAQEVQMVAPELVSGDERLKLNMLGTIPYLHAAIMAIKARVDRL